ncbi:sensor histidine kinase [Larkinella humicola]|uniref:histidine kinase n=1 Tax=Larkinella humicola TaxID=2607654 RepID=A0A5N1J8F9_9BACT|nr:HAMP domain-containing sensor histidine kinase [Larkinella humicola]KAA9347966.1 HAMP domain-containing histidine kinase [Larkinella humicola]
MRAAKETLYKLIGSPDGFSLEARIFNSICVLILVVMGYNIPFSFSVGLPETGWICTVLLGVSGYVYYLNRIRKKMVAALTIAGVVITILFAVNYFFNSGMSGASLLSFTITLFLLLIAGPSRHSLFWVLFNLTVVLSLLTIEYLHPQFIVETYPTRLAQTVDLASTYSVNVFFLYFGTLFFTKAYKLEQKRVEERSVVFERLNEEKNKLFSIVSHDLRSPLASVQQYLEMLKQIELDSDVRKKIESELLVGINHTQEMLVNLLSWSTGQMRGTTVTRTSVNVSACLKPIIEIYKPLAAQKEIQLVFRGDGLPTVLADGNLLQLIVRNLVGNAIKFTPTGGQITIEATRTDTSGLITVKDTGRGIKEADKPRLFSLKAQPTFGTNNERGVGLGLFLCKQYAEAQQGAIWFESQESVGTTFFLALPLPMRAKN